MVRIVNIVASGDFGREMDLGSISEDIASHVVVAQYDPETFSGLQIRFEQEGTLVTVYSTGRYTVMGAKDVEQIETILAKLVDAFDQIGLRVTGDDTSPVIKNIVCKEELDVEIDLEELLHNLSEGTTEYEPEQSPFVYYWPDSTECLITIANNGEIIVTGVAEVKDAREAVRQFKNELNNTSFDNMV